MSFYVQGIVPYTWNDFHSSILPFFGFPKKNGKGHSSTFLFVKKNGTPEKAIEKLKIVRPIVNPKLSFGAQLLVYHNQLNEKK